MLTPNIILRNQSMHPLPVAKSASTSPEENGKEHIANYTVGPHNEHK